MNVFTASDAQSSRCNCKFVNIVSQQHAAHTSTLIAWFNCTYVRQMNAIAQQILNRFDFTAVKLFVCCDCTLIYHVQALDNFCRHAMNPLKHWHLHKHTDDALISHLTDMQSDDGTIAAALLWSLISWRVWALACIFNILLTMCVIFHSEL